MDLRYISLPRTLKYADRLSMSQGIEARVPFLQKDFLNLYLTCTTGSNLEIKKLDGLSNNI